MKSLVNGTILTLLITSFCSAQWFWQNSGTTNYLESVFFIDSNTGWAVGYNEIILKTTDGGENWETQYSTGLVNYLNSVFFVDSNYGWAVGGGSRILKTTNGGTDWMVIANGFNINLESVYFTDVNTGWAVGEWKVLKTTDGGITWVSQNSEYLHSVYFIDAVTGWAVGLGPVIIKTTDGGESWITQISGSGAVFKSVYFIDSNIGWAVGYVAVSGGYGIIYKTTDGGNNWTNQIIFSTQSLNSVCFTDSNTGWTVGANGKIFKTSNGGDDWAVQNSSGYPNGLNCVYFIDSNTGWTVGTDGIILKTTNGGLPVELTSFMAQSENQQVVLNWTTATETNNRGFEVQRKSNDQEFITIGFVKGNGTSTEQHSYSYIDKNLNTGSYSYRLKQYDFDGSFYYSEVVKVEFNNPLNFTLSQNYPNPFNPTTAIKYSIPQASFVTLKIYDAIGNEISTLVNQIKGAGDYEVYFNADQLSSGIYFYKLQAGSFIDTRKMILLK